MEMEKYKLMISNTAPYKSREIKGVKNITSYE